MKSILVCSFTKRCFDHHLGKRDSSRFCDSLLSEIRIRSLVCVCLFRWAVKVIQSCTNDVVFCFLLLTVQSLDVERESET